jgi:hypothetical protein
MPEIMGSLGTTRQLTPMIPLDSSKGLPFSETPFTSSPFGADVLSDRFENGWSCSGISAPGESGDGWGCIGIAPKKDSKVPICTGFQPSKPIMIPGVALDDNSSIEKELMKRTSKDPELKALLIKILEAEPTSMQEQLLETELHKKLRSQGTSDKELKELFTLVDNWHLNNITKQASDFIDAQMNAMPASSQGS